MKRLTILLLLFAFSAGCKKTMDKLADDAKPGADEKPKIIPNGTGDLSVGGGGGGAAQAVRKAAARTINDVELDQLKLTIVQAMTEDPDQKPPSADQIKDLIKQNGKLVGLIKDDVIVLTNSQRPDGILAYTKWPQRAGKHYAIKASGRAEMTPAELADALKAQGTEAHLEK